MQYFVFLEPVSFPSHLAEIKKAQEENRTQYTNFFSCQQQQKKCRIAI